MFYLSFNFDFYQRQGGGAGTIVLVPGGPFWTRRRAGAGFRCVVSDTHDYFLLRPKAGRLSSKSGPDMIIACGDLRLSSKSGPESRSGWWPWCFKSCTRTLTIYGVACGLIGGPGVPKSCTRTSTLAGWCCAGARWGGVKKIWVVQTVVPESPLCILLRCIIIGR